MTAPLRVRFTGNRLQAIVSGNGARTLLLELRGRLPVWSRKWSGYSVTEATARDVLAIAESRRWLVVVAGQPEAPPVAPEPVVQADDAQEALW